MRLHLEFAALVLLLCLGVVASGPASAAAERVGQVTQLQGVVTVATADGVIRFLRRGQAIHEGDLINTGSGSFVKMRFIDDSSMYLRPNSRFRVETLEYDEETEEGRGFFDLIKGGFRAVTGLVSRFRPERYKVRTAVATIGIRGTDFQARLCQRDCLDLLPQSHAPSRTSGAPSLRHAVLREGRGMCGGSRAGMLVPAAWPGAAAWLQPVQFGPPDGLYLGVNAGGVTLTNEQGEVTSFAGQFAFVCPGCAPEPVPKPQIFKFEFYPSPDTPEDPEFQGCPS